MFKSGDIVETEEFPDGLNWLNAGYAEPYIEEIETAALNEDKVTSIRPKRKRRKKTT